MDNNNLKDPVNLIGINGKIGSGKDTIGSIIQYVVCLHKNTLAEHQKDFAYFQQSPVSNSVQSGWQIKKFAGKLKTVASLLTGIPVEMLEDQKFKTKALGREWCYPTEWQGREHWVEMTVREFLQKLGTEAMRDGLHTNVWVNALFADYKEEFISKGIGGFQDPRPSYKSIGFPNWIITDLRFPNEIEAIVERKGITIRVNRPGISLLDHPSETSLDNAEFDYTIVNDSTIKDLVIKVRKILVKEKII